MIDVAQLTLHYPNGMLAFIHVSWLSPSKIRRFTIVGDRQMVVYDDVETIDKIRVYNRGIEVPDHTSTFGEFQLSYRYGDIVSPFLHWSEPLGMECERFADAILKRGAPRSDANDGLRVVRVLEATDSLNGRRRRVHRHPSGSSGNLREDHTTAPFSSAPTRAYSPATRHGGKLTHCAWRSGTASPLACELDPALGSADGVLADVRWMASAKFSALVSAVSLGAGIAARSAGEIG